MGIVIASIHPQRRQNEQKRNAVTQNIGEVPTQCGHGGMCGLQGMGKQEVQWKSLLQHPAQGAQIHVVFGDRNESANAAEVLEKVTRQKQHVSKQQTGGQMYVDSVAVWLKVAEVGEGDNADDQANGGQGTAYERQDVLRRAAGYFLTSLHVDEHGKAGQVVTLTVGVTSVGEQHATSFLGPSVLRRVPEHAVRGRLPLHRQLVWEHNVNAFVQRGQVGFWHGHGDDVRQKNLLVFWSAVDAVIRRERSVLLDDRSVHGWKCKKCHLQSFLDIRRALIVKT